MESNIKKRRLEGDNNDRPTKKMALANNEDLNNIFLVEEVIEHVVSNLLTKPKAILNLSAVTKRHNRVIRSKAMWLRLGFSENLCKEDIVPPTNLKFLLNCLRIDHIRRKSANELATLERYAYKYNDEIQYGVTAMEDNSTPAIRQYITNTKLTDQAFGAIYDILFKAGFIQHKIDMKSFLELILASEEQVKREQQARAQVNQGSRIRYFPTGFCNSFFSELDDGKPHYTFLVAIDDGFENKHYCMSKRFINDDKFVIMVQHPSDYYFIKIDLSKNLIEVCGELRTYLNYKKSGTYEFFLPAMSAKFAELFEVPNTTRLGELERTKLCMSHCDILSSLGGREKVLHNVPLFKK